MFDFFGKKQHILMVLDNLGKYHYFSMALTVQILLKIDRVDLAK